MPTIGQLPSLAAVDAADELPISHNGTTQSTSVGTLLAGLQPAIQASTGTLLGRVSLGPGTPESINIGVGLDLQANLVVATGADHANFPNQAVLNLSDQAVVSSGGSPRLLELSLLRGLFTAGTDVNINTGGTITASVTTTATDTGATPYSVADLPVATTISSNDLVGISHGGSAEAITYQNFLNGLTISEAQAAIAVSNGDTTWVAQGSDTMLCQTFSAIWAWIVSNQPSYKWPVIEISTDTTLDGTVHNGRILVCSQPVTLTPVFTNMGSGFACSVINLCDVDVSFGAGIVSSAGTSVLSAGLSCTMQGITYSGGSVIYAAMSSGGAQSASTIPGIIRTLAVAAVSSNGISLTWEAPSAGGDVTSYTVQYQMSGATAWTAASHSVIGTSYSVANLSPSTSYNFTVLGANSAGLGPISGTVSGTTAATPGLAPGQVTGLTASTATSSSVSLAWSAPSVGATPITYTINCRQSGTTTWLTSASGVSSMSANVVGLLASTGYDFEILASNAIGAGIPSAIVSLSTTATETSLTAVTWNLTPSGSYMAGSGSIGVNAWVTPSNAAVRFGFSPSPTVPPASWTAAVLVNSNLWGAYVNTPTTIGSSYVWVEGTDGSLPTAYATPFTVT